MAIHSSILAWRIPWSEEAGGWGKWRPGRVVARTSVGVRADGALARVREGAVGPSE